MKIATMLERVKNKAVPAVLTDNLQESKSITQRIYEFASNVSYDAEREFELDPDQGELIYNLLIESIKYFKGYPEE